MSRFLDGPAENVEIMLRRAPVLLRVVRASTGGWDALDQLHDQPESDESVHVYIRVTKPIGMHLLIRGKNRNAGGWYESADYRFITEAADQPSSETVRSTALWRSWCQECGRRLVEKYTGQ